MVNSYKSLRGAIHAWRHGDWVFERAFFTEKGEAAVCKHKRKNGRFFIVIHPECVAYRIKQGEFVKGLNR